MALNQVTVTIDNAAPDAGTNLTPLWVGFHNGEFDTYDRGRPVSPGLESVAEDGDNALITQEFALSGLGDVDGTLGDAPLAPSGTTRQTFNVDASEGRFFNYAAMVLPSNDTFIANGNPLVHEIFDEAGNFVGADILVTGAQALDAGSEINDEIPANTAFFGQQTPNTGVDENGTVQLSTGFNPVGSGGILDDPRFANADFTAPDYQIARIRVSAEESARLSSALSADQEPEGGGNPNASGTSEFVLNEFGDALSYELNVSGLDFGQFVGDGTAQTEDTSDDVTRIHLHNADRGVNGDVAFGLIDQVLPAADGQDSDDLEIIQNEDGSTTLRGIWETTDPALTSLTEFVDSIQNAEAGADIPLYWNIHTNGSPGGAIRGQLQGGEDAVAQPPVEPPVEPPVNQPNNIVIDDRQREAVSLGLGDSLTVNGRLRVDGTAVELATEAQDVTIQVNKRGSIRGNTAIDGSNAAGGLTVNNAGAIRGDVLLTNGNDVYDGANGRLTGKISGGLGDDTLLGGNNRDTLLGGADNDTLNGGGGRNFLEGGTGSDALISGRSRDTFIFGADLLQDAINDVDTISGFDRRDQLDFSQYLGAGGSITAANKVNGDQGSLLNVELSSGDAISISGDINAAFNQVQQFV